MSLIAQSGPHHFWHTKCLLVCRAVILQQIILETSLDYTEDYYRQVALGYVWIGSFQLYLLSEKWRSTNAGLIFDNLPLYVHLTQPGAFN